VTTLNRINLSCDGKFRNEIASYKRVRKTADRISEAHNLSVVDNPALSKGESNRYKTPTKRDGLAGVIDEILTTQQPKDFDDFLKHLEKSGCKVKHRGKTISVMPEGAERYFRLKAGKKGLPEGYDEESLRKRIDELQAERQDEGQAVYNEATPPALENYVTDTPFGDAETVLDDSDAPTAETPDTPPDITAEPSSRITHDKKINLLIDLANSMKAQESKDYERWATGFNLQQAAETLLFLQTNNLTDMEALTHAANQAQAEYDALQSRIKFADTRIKEVNTLQRYIGSYDKNRSVYSQYLRTGRNPKFRAANEKAIATAEEAKAYFDSLGLVTIPSITELRAEYSALHQEKNQCYQARTDMRRHVLDLQSAKKNTEMLLGIPSDRENERIKKRGDDSEL
jgi:hypothetical protein